MPATDIPLNPAQTPLYLSRQIRNMERQAPGGVLMHKAGQAIAALAQQILEDNADPVLVVAGPGNNGGDALVAALALKNRWHHVIVVLAGEPDELPADAARAYAAWIAAGERVLLAIPPHMRFSLAIDGLFGIGLQRPLQGEHAQLVRQINALPCPVLAIDIPSGLHADTGQVLGCAITATRTLTFLGRKPGLYTLGGPQHAGIVHFDALGITPERDTPGWLIQPGILSALPRRQLNSHKGMFGDVAVLGGSEGMTGALLLAARAALLCGSGRVYGGFLASAAPVVDMQQPEIMLRTAAGIAELPRLNAVIIGPGLGQTAAACELLEYWLGQPIPLLLDADALNLLACHAHLQEIMQARTTAGIITPHPLEAARLLACSSAEIQRDRIASAVGLARKFNAVCVLKGAGSICAAPGGEWHINSSGNPGLASAGTGDV
ncbi:MAG TPA: NAD(P)H-hydrate dehydratase, partial [Methylophilaceae bacterium]|nr:NAD(P)H-hydrate dehydratase [Methylophilaceae bacterium]